MLRPNQRRLLRDRKSTRLNSSHVRNSYAVFCLKKKKDSPGNEFPGRSSDRQWIQEPCGPANRNLNATLTKAPVQLPLCPCFARSSFFFFNDTATTEIYTLSLHDALPISPCWPVRRLRWWRLGRSRPVWGDRKSTRLNSSHVRISYAVFCLKKKNKPK